MRVLSFQAGVRRTMMVWALALTGCATTPALQTVSHQPAAGEWPKTCVAVWQAQSLPGKRVTRYDAWADDGRPTVRARADRSASLMRHRLRIEPASLGRVTFSWRVPALMQAADVSQRDSEDSPVRLVLAFEGDENALSSRDRMLFELAETLSGERPPFATLMYVWDNRAPVGTVVQSTRTGRIRKIVVDSGADHVGVWRPHDRDIAADFEQAYGERPGALVAVALMTDADNTGEKTTASYGPVCFPGADVRALVR